MHILVTSWRGPGHPLSGGAEQVTWQHMKGWHQAGHSVTLFTSAYPQAMPHEIKEGITIIRQGDQFIGVRLAFAKWYIFSSHPKFDLIVDEFHGLPFFTPLFVRKPILGFIHEVAGPVWKLNPWPFPWNLGPYIFGQTLEKLTFYIYRSKPFFTVSNSTVKDLKSLGISNITVINNGIISSPKKISSTKEKFPTFIFLSALAKDKGIEDVIETFKFINKTLPESKFWVVGKGHPEYLLEIKKQAKDLPITFWGYVSEFQKFELLSRAHVMVFPSAHEGWGLVVIEANSVGTPVAVYPSAGLIDSTKSGHNGEISPLKTPESLANTAINILQSPIYSKYCHNSIIWAKRFTWPKSVQKSLKLLSEISKQSHN